jgi:hypothetical protein
MLSLQEIVEVWQTTELLSDGIQREVWHPFNGLQASQAGGEHFFEGTYAAWQQPS